MAALLTHAQNWAILDDTNSSVVLEAAYLGSYESLCLLPIQATANINPNNFLNAGGTQSLEFEGA